MPPPSKRVGRNSAVPCRMRQRLLQTAQPVVLPRSRARMDGIDGLAFAGGAGRVAGTMMVSLKEVIVVVEDGGSLVLGGTGCRSPCRSAAHHGGCGRSA